MATTLPFKVYEDEDRDRYNTYSSAYDLEQDLNAYSTNGAAPFSDNALKTLRDYLNQYADYTEGVWEGTDVPLSIDTIDGDDFTSLLVKADNGELD